MCLVLLPACTGVFSSVLIMFCFVLFYHQFAAMKKYIEGGGSMLVMIGEGGEAKFETNINFFLEEHGIMVNNGKYILLSCCI